MRAASRSAGGLSLTYDGPSGALLARGFVEAGRAGYSAPVEFADPAAFRTSSLHGGGVRLSGPDGSPVSPVVVATNAGPVSTTVMGAFVTSSPEGEVLRFPLPSLSLAPGETAVLDSALAEAGARAAGAGTPAGLELDYTTPPGSVLVTAASVSPDLNQVFRVPLIDPETPKSSTGGYPWRAGGQTATVVYLKNTTTEPQNYVLQLTFAGGVYAPGLKTLKPGETLTLDIKALRDAQVPDAFGHTIPREAAGGQVHWSAKGRTRHAIIGRAEHVDHDHGVSASYACINCCPNNPYEWWTEGDPIVIPIGDWVTVYVYIRDIDCYNNLLAPYSLVSWHGQDWWISDTNIAVGDNNATVTGIGGGSTTFHFTYSAEYWYPDVHEFGWFCNYYPFPLPYETPVEVQGAHPVDIRINPFAPNNPFVDNGSSDHLPYMRYSYIFESSTGNLADLGECEVLEQVTYPTWPIPPFQTSPGSFVAKMADGTAGVFVDTHTTQGPMQKDSQGNAAVGSVTATQTCLWRCQNIQNNALQVFTSGANSGTHTIVRSVTTGSGQTGWRFAITKHDVTASCDLSTSGVSTGFCHSQ